MKKEQETDFPLEKTKLIFSGSIINFLVFFVLFVLLIVVTFGLAFPFFIYWLIHFTINNTEICTD